jgi:transcriptional regulator with XRE-family HTH domain
MSDSELRQLGKRIRETRIRLGLTQLEVAEKADTSANYFAQIERGEVNPSYSMLRAIARALKVKLNDLIP